MGRMNPKNGMYRGQKHAPKATETLYYLVLEFMLKNYDQFFIAKNF